MFKRFWAWMFSPDVTTYLTVLCVRELPSGVRNWMKEKRIVRAKVQGTESPPRTLIEWGVPLDRIPKHQREFFDRSADGKEMAVTVLDKSPKELLLWD